MEIPSLMELAELPNRGILVRLAVTEYGPHAHQELAVLAPWFDQEGVTITFADGHLSFDRGMVPDDTPIPSGAEWVLSMNDAQLKVRIEQLDMG